MREELKLVPIVLCGAETIRRLVLRVSLLLNDRLLLEGGRFPGSDGEGPVAKRSLIEKEKERLEGGAVSSLPSMGEEAALVGIVVAALSSYRSKSLSASTSPRRIGFRADTNVGVYRRSG